MEEKKKGRREEERIGVKAETRGKEEEKEDENRGREDRKHRKERL